MVGYGIVGYGMVGYDMVWYGIVGYGMVGYHMVGCGMVGYGWVLGMAIKNYPKLTLFNALESAHWFLSYGKVVFHCQLMCTVSSPLYWARKTTPK